MEPSESANCLKDMDQLLVGFCDLLQQKATPNPEPTSKYKSNTPKTHNSPDYSRQDYELYLQECAEPGNSNSSIPSLEDHACDHLSDSAIYYFSGYMANTYIKCNKCAECRKLLFTTERAVMTGPEQMFTAYKAYEPSQSDIFSGLSLSSDAYFAFIKTLDTNFTSIFSKYANQRGVAELVFKDYVSNILPVTNFRLCSEDALYYLVEFYIRCKIYFAVRMHNRRNGKTLTVSKATAKAAKSAKRPNKSKQKNSKRAKK